MWGGGRRGVPPYFFFVLFFRLFGWSRALILPADQTQRDAGGEGEWMASATTKAAQQSTPRSRWSINHPPRIRSPLAAADPTGLSDTGHTAITIEQRSDVPLWRERRGELLSLPDSPSIKSPLAKSSTHSLDEMHAPSHSYRRSCFILASPEREREKREKKMKENEERKSQQTIQLPHLTNRRTSFGYPISLSVIQCIEQYSLYRRNRRA